MDIGNYVRTVRPQMESKDWSKDARVCVRWGSVTALLADEVQRLHAVIDVMEKRR